MNAQEALEIITNAIQTNDMTAEQDKALAIAQKALEKQIPKKPRITLHGTTDYNTTCKCRSCGSFVNTTDNYCRTCGQAIERSNT